MNRAIVGASLLALAACCGCSEQSTVSHGWTPNWIPGAATEVDAVHHRNISQDWLPIGTPFPELRGLHSECSPLSGEPARLPQQMRSWWPLRSSLRGSESSDAYRFYRCNEGGATTYVAADAKSGTAYFWRE
jgi:hypothetical protein